VSLNKCAPLAVAALLAVAAASAAPAPTAAPDAKKEPIKIGAIFSVTGPTAFLGAPEANTAQMLVDQINAAGGILGHQVQLLIKDSQGDAEKAISAAKQLIDETKVLAIIGPSTSGETMKIKGICQEGKTILVSCAAAEDIVNPVASYVFKVPQKDSQAAQRIYATMKQLGIKKIGVIADQSGFGNAGKAQLEKLAPVDSMTIVASESYDPKATDLTDVLAKLKAAGAMAVVNWSVAPAQAIVAKNMKQMKFDVPLFQSHGFGNIKYVQLAGEAAEGIIFPCGRLLVADVLPATHPQKALLSKYKKDYETKFAGEAVSTFGGHAYDAILVLQKAIESAKSVEKEAVRTAIENIKGLVGTAGTFNMSATDHNGIDISGFEMLTVKGGQFALYTPPAPVAAPAKNTSPAPAAAPAKK
jgi:branched-chain amino acid transport system substrate-binding protein